MVLVRVRQHDGAHLTWAVTKIGQVGQHEVDTEVLVARERETCVDDEHPLLVLEHGHVLADLAEPAERNDA